MPYVPEDKRTTVWYLLEPKFMVRVPPMALRTVDDIKLFGTATSGDEYVDKEMAKNLTVCMLSVAAMEEIHHRGYDVGVVNYDDTKKIYEYITNHLVAFKNLFQSSENVAPEADLLDELIRLDKFATAVYGPAKHLMNGDLVHSLLARRLKSGGVSSLTRSALSSKQRVLASVVQPVAAPTSGGGRDYGTNVPVSVMAPVTAPMDDESGLPERISLTSMFERQKRLGDTRWK